VTVVTEQIGSSSTRPYGPVMLGHRPRQLLGAAIPMIALVACSNPGANGSTTGPSLTPCDEQDSSVCVVNIAALDSDAALAMESAVALDAGASVSLEAGSCGRGGNGPSDIVWSLCSLTLSDGRQMIVGRATEDDLVARAVVDGEPVQFPLTTRPGEATLLAAPSRSFSATDPAVWPH